MCQVEHIKEMDCTNYFEKARERLMFFIKNPINFMYVAINNIKKNNPLKIHYRKTLSRVSSGISDSQKVTIPPLSIFKEGEEVRVRSKEEILRTLDVNNKLEGCLFMEEMWQYCGTRQKILKRIDYFYDEASYRMCKARNTVLLKDIHCSGKFQRYTTTCDRFCLFFWREEWLEKIN